MKYFVRETERFSANPYAVWEESSGKGDGEDAHMPERVFPIKTFFKYHFLIDF